ncbi:MAG: PEP-CTERM sorting domain-containing protein [Phycisphaeraceae bacterium]|nr:PEP-CTERM sorting domain-containing protein [Phycisphaeraceae bacterium]
MSRHIHHLFTCVFACVLSSLLATTALADWNPGDSYKMHYPQLPDLQTGLDVLDGPYLAGPTQPLYSKFLADDFLCTETGPITDIHVWGSWLNDVNPQFGAAGVIGKNFQLAIYSDVPAVPGGPYSHPGDLLWSTTMIARERLYAPATEEFFDPNQNQIIGADTAAWQYNFFIDPSEAFVQEAGKIYWLGVALSADVNGDGVVDLLDMSLMAQYAPWAYGWKTSRDKFNDDAVWVDYDWFGSGTPTGVPTDPLAWHELIHPFTGESLDLAFVITTPEPASLALLALGGVILLKRRG